MKLCLKVLGTSGGGVGSLVWRGISLGGVNGDLMEMDLLTGDPGSTLVGVLGEEGGDSLAHSIDRRFLLSLLLPRSMAMNVFLYGAVGGFTIFGGTAGFSWVEYLLPQVFSSIASVCLSLSLGSVEYLTGL